MTNDWTKEVNPSSVEYMYVCVRFELMLLSLLCSVLASLVHRVELFVMFFKFSMQEPLRNSQGMYAKNETS